MGEDDCIFCKLSRGEVKVQRIYENDNFFSMYDANQDIKGHALVISKKHFDNSLDMPSSLGTELIDCIKKTAIVLLEKYKATGFNILNNNFKDAGQVVKHTHFHIIPRKEGDKIRILG